MGQLSPNEVNIDLIEGSLLLQRVPYRTSATRYSRDIIFSHFVQQNGGGQCISNSAVSFRSSSDY
jgi:hypothetical protein